MHRPGELFQFLPAVAMPVPFIGHIVIMRMGVSHRMGVGAPVVGVGKGMLMQMLMLTDQRIRSHQKRTRHHDKKRCKVCPGKILP